MEAATPAAENPGAAEPAESAMTDVKVKILIRNTVIVLLKERANFIFNTGTFIVRFPDL
jgi:hypothetical protein